MERRTLSLLDECKRLLAESGQAKALLPFLTFKKDVIRWMARQVSPLLPGQALSIDVIQGKHAYSCVTDGNPQRHHISSQLPASVQCLAQVLLNTATLEVAAERMEADGAPVHIHGMNLVRLRRSQSQANRHSPLLLDLQAKLYAPFSQA